MGAVHTECAVDDIVIDTQHKLVTTPAYMLAQSISQAAGITLHIDRKHGFNSHHIAEAAFKAVAKSLRMAVEIDARVADQLPSTKGKL